MAQINNESALFAGFAATTKAQWREQVTKDLKGKALDTLVWHTDEGFPVEPYYTAEDLEHLPAKAVQSAQASRERQQWENREIVPVTDIATASRNALSALEKGAQAVVFDLSGTAPGSVDIDQLLAGMDTTQVPVFFRTAGAQTQFTWQTIQRRIMPPMKGGLMQDPLTEWMHQGEWPADLWSNLAAMLRSTRSVPGFRVLSVDGQQYQHAGGNAAQELAFTLAAAVTYFDKLTDEGCSLSEILTGTEFSVAVGTNYLMEIAKLRALRYLLGKVVEQYEPGVAPALFVHAQTSTFYQAALEPYTNLLRATTEAMAAVIGGCDALTVLPYDAPWGESDEFSRRIARNVSTILKEESYLDKVQDPAAGSYYLERLTYQLVEQAWKLFTEVEQLGGLIPAFERGFVRQELNKSYQEKVSRLREGKLVMVGVNKYQGVTTRTEAPAAPAVQTSGTLPATIRLSQITEQELPASTRI